MNHRIILLLPGFLAAFFMAFSQSASLKPLDHSVYDFWQTLDNSQISPSGNYISWEVNPQKGDNWLYLLEVASGRKDSFPRSSQAVFSPEETFFTFRIKPHEDSMRKAKLAKKKDDELPKDSLGIWLMGARSLSKMPQIQSFQVPTESGSWLGYLLKPEKVKAPSDSTQTDSTSTKPPEDKKKKDTWLFISNPVTGDSFSFDSVEEFMVGENGNAIAFTQVFGDSIDSVSVKIFDTATRTDLTIFKNAGRATKPVLDKAGDQFAILVTQDTGEVKVFDLYYLKGKAGLVKIVDQNTPGMEQGWAVSTNGNLKFSPSGERIWLGTAPIPPTPVKDTLTDDEKVRVDIWNWQDMRLQPQQQVELEKDKKKNYTAVWHINSGRLVQLATESVDEVFIQREGDDNVIYGFYRLPYLRQTSWQYPDFKDVYVIDVNSGETQMIVKNRRYATRLSPDGKYLVWYEPSDTQWYASPVAERQDFSLTKGLKVAFYDEKHDTPQPAFPYGIEGFGENQSFVVIKDRYDLWKFDLTGKEKPVNLTGKYGRKNNIRFEYVDTDSENPFLENDYLLLKGVSEEDQSEGFYRLQMSGKYTLEKLISDNASFRNVAMAGSADKLIWTRRTFTDNPDLYVSDSRFSAPQKLTAINPQQKEYRWGRVEPVEWKSPDGKSRKGLLYTPEDLDPTKKYPLLVYFYEVLSDRRYWYFSPSPSRSTINPAYYTSNEYIVFYPDIEYTTGQPGNDAYDAVVSGTEFLVDKYPFIDKTRMGLQGHSWGGYQAAYIITKTNMFRAAMAGAPVSNMTSAYGGIRWESGMSRMFQYEETQSRIGTTLWENPQRYLDNSPLFSAPNIQTPLLMMHNDADGAVPWYQGIELFTALRRLDKPVWMLVYNGEKHNLTKWPNRVDLSIRMQQFFDYYLKDAPIPAWMDSGVPAVEKGVNMGY
ncbi:MAG: prolyl oligopeptidase family serine peptidase [Bacteroidia bacterium]